jgi:serpin B
MSLIYCYYACDNENVSAIPDKSVKEDVTATEVIEPFMPIELTVRQGKKADADNYFSFKMFKEVSAQNGANTFFSPLSLNMALGMLYNATSGKTRTEMADALGLADFTESEINEYYQKMMQGLLNIDPLTEISIANSIWYRDSLPVKQSFFDTNKQYFDAMVQSLDFSKSEAAGIINNWCADKTKDRITKIVESPINDLTMMYLINALYFKSKWQFEFDRAKTKQDDFILTGNHPKRVNMMEQTATLPYYADQRLQCVEMPYGNEAFSMVAILPTGAMSIDQMIGYLNHTEWQNIVNKLSPQKVWLKLPRFKIECEMPLKESVRNAGMKRIFIPLTAELGNMVDLNDMDDLHVSDIKQKTFVEVNEEGTEAAAVTAVEIQATSIGLGSDPVRFFANRPFLYLIKEKSTGAILFIGRMDEPKE